MSHFSQIKTQIRHLPALQAALTDLGLVWQAGSKAIRGYRGLSQTADIAIEQENGYDIGFRWNGNEYELVADLQFWRQDWTVERFLSRVTQRYAYHTVLTETTQQGFQVTEQQENKDGSIRLVLQRWGA